MTEHNMSGPSKELDEIGAGSSGMLASSEMEGEDEYYNPDGTEWSQKAGLLCRICANPNEYLIPIFDGEGLEHELGTKIQKHLPIKVTETDTLPIHVCYQCASTLIAWHDLVNCCVEADKKLRELQMVEDDEDDDDKGAEMFESHSFDSEMVAEDDGPSTSELQNQAPEIKSPKKLTVDKKSKLKMVLVKGSAAGTSGQKIVPKIQVAKVELGKPKEGTSQDSASERSHGFGNMVFIQETPTATLQDVGNMQFFHTSQIGNYINTEEDDEQLYSIWIKTDEDEKEYYLCDVKEAENEVQISKERYISASDGLLDTRLANYEVNIDMNSSSQLADHDYVQTSSNGNILNKGNVHHDTVGLPLMSGLVKAPKRYYLKCVKVGGKCYSKVAASTQPVQCKYCLKCFGSEAVSLTHVRIHTGFSPFYCKYCGKSFRLSSSLIRHVNKCLPSLNMGMGTDVSHPLTKGNNERYMCTICGKMYKLKPSLKDHLRAHFGKARCKQKCDVCGEKFLTKAEIKEHVLIHKCRNFFSCDTCEKKFITERDLTDHMISHTDERPYCCFMCGATYKRKSHLNRHALNHANRQLASHCTIKKTTGVMFSCKYCGKECLTPRLLVLHEISHTGERNFECHICGKRFAQSGALSRHIHVVHDGAKDFSCEICNQSFTAKATKDNHMRIHTGEKPFQCDTCGKTFRTQQQLRIHERVHSDLRPYPCPYCVKRFRRRPHLIVHIRTHTGEKPYGCPICGRCFAQKNDMTKHVQIHNR